MKCPSCGSENLEEYQFCSVCGTQLVHPAPYAAPIPTYIERSRKRRNMHIVMAIVGVVAILAVLVYVFATMYVMGGTLVITIDPAVDREVHYKMYVWDRLEQEGNISANGSMVYTYSITWKVWVSDPQVNVNVMMSSDDWQGANQTQWVTMGLGARKYVTFDT